MLSGWYGTFSNGVSEIVKYSSPEQRSQDAKEFAAGLTQGLNFSTFVLDMPKTHHYFKKWGKWHFVYAFDRILSDIICLGILAQLGDENGSSIPGKIISWSIFLMAVALVSIKWAIAQAIYFGLIGSAACEDTPRKNKIDYKGAWLDKTVFAGLQSSLIYLLDFHSLKLVGSLLSSVIPGTRWLVNAIIDGRSLVEYIVIANSKDGVPFETRRELVANNMPYAFGMGTALYGVYSLLSYIFEAYVGFKNPVLDSALYGLIYALFIMQAYQVHELPHTHKRYDLFIVQNKLWKFILQEAKQPMIDRLVNVDDSQKIKKLLSMHKLLEILTGFKNMKQYAEREEITDWLLANEYGINLFFAIVISVQNAYANNMVRAAAYLAKGASDFFTNNNIAVPHNIGEIIKECLASPLYPVAIKYLADKKYSPITPESYNSFKILINHIKGVRVALTEKKEVSQVSVLGEDLRLVENYDQHDQSKLPVAEVSTQTMGEAQIAIAKEKEQLPLPPSIVTPIPLASESPAPAPVSAPVSASPPSVGTGINLFASVHPEYDPEASNQTVSPPPGLRQRQGTKQGSH